VNKAGSWSSTRFQFDLEPREKIDKWLGWERLADPTTASDLRSESPKLAPARVLSARQARQTWNTVPGPCGCGVADLQHVVL
jgi:hypothetical protein